MPCVWAGHSPVEPWLSKLYLTYRIRALWGSVKSMTAARFNCFTAISGRPRRSRQLAKSCRRLCELAKLSLDYWPTPASAPYRPHKAPCLYLMWSWQFPWPDKAKDWREKGVEWSEGGLIGVLSETYREQLANEQTGTQSSSLRAFLEGLRGMFVLERQIESKRLPACWRLHPNSRTALWCYWLHWKPGTTAKTRSSDLPQGSWEGWGRDGQNGEVGFWNIETGKGLISIWAYRR